MMRNVVLFIIILAFVSCASRSNKPSGGGGKENFRYCAYGNPLLHERRILLEFILSGTALESGGTFTVGPAELLGNNATMESWYEPFIPYSKHIHALVGKKSIAYPFRPLFVELYNMGSDSLQLLLHYSYTLENDTLYEVTEGTLNIPIYNVRERQLNRVEFEDMPLKQTFTKAAQRIILNVDNLIL